MKKGLTLLLACMLSFASLQAQNLNLPPASKKASVTEYIGLTGVTIDYHRPGVKGREGKIYGEGALVPYNGGKPFPWRAGADENTTILFQDDVTINGQPLPAGTYGFHIIPAEKEWTLIFSHNNHSWGSFFYKQSEDALRVNVTPRTCDFTEWLTYDFVNQTDESADVRLRWERKEIIFTVATNVHDAVLTGIGKQLEGLDGFNWQSYVAAANYCLQNGKDLDKALTWTARSLDPNFAGQENFQTLTTRALVLRAMGKTTEPETLIAKALPLGTMLELHQYARQLIASGDAVGAMEVFQLNRQKYPEEKFVTVVGLARGNMAMEHYKDAAKYFHEAAANAPAGQAAFYENLAKQCEEKM